VTEIGSTLNAREFKGINFVQLKRRKNNKKFPLNPSLNMNFKINWECTNSIRLIMEEMHLKIYTK
jgi:hypothetical protein